MNEIPSDFRSVGERTVSRLEELNRQIIDAYDDQLTRGYSGPANELRCLWTGEIETGFGEAEPFETEFWAAHDQMNRSYLDDDLDDGALKEMAERLTELIDGYVKALRPRGSQIYMLYLGTGFYLLGKIRTNLREYDAVIEDATASYLLLSGLLGGGVPLDAMLFLKGFAEFARGNLETAKEDLRACCAHKRERGVDLFESDAVRYLLGVMARLKDGTPRPHYTDREIHETCRELQLEHYSSKSMVCLVCQKPPSADVRLRLCAGCQSTWFCGRECQKKAWKRHKASCTPRLRKTSVICAHTLEAKFRAVIDDGGFALTEHKASGTQALCIDPETGGTFQSLSDQDITFLDPNDGDSIAPMMIGMLLGGSAPGGSLARRDGAMGPRGPVVGMQYPDPHFICHPRDAIRAGRR
jgi:hypothetical protein